ncbi:MAG: glycosyltransferase [Micromonosporaceae bacterium]
MKIALVSAHVSPLAPAGTGPGGQNIHVAGLARELGRRGHEVTIYTRKDSGSLPHSVATGPRVTVEHVPAGPPRPLPPGKELSCMAQFGAYLADRWLREPPDVTHAHSLSSGLAALTGTRDLGLPVVQTFHGLAVAAQRWTARGRGTGPGAAGGAEAGAGADGAAAGGTAARIRLEVAIARDADAVLATSSDEAFQLTRLGVPRTSVAVVPSGVATDRFTPEGPAARRGDMHRLVTVGPLARESGFEEILRALPSVPDCELLIAGGPAKPQLRRDREYRRLARLASQLKVADRVKFCGRVAHQEMPALLRSADLVVSVPWYNSSGRVLLEAMACGTPVVASAVGGHIDTVVDGTTGVFISRVEPTVLAGRIRDLLATPMLRQGYGIAGADRARARYSWQRIGQETLAAYDRVRRSKTGRRAAAGARARAAAGAQAR